MSRTKIRRRVIAKELSKTAENAFYGKDRSRYYLLSMLALRKGQTQEEQSRILLAIRAMLSVRRVDRVYGDRLIKTFKSHVGYESLLTVVDLIIQEVVDQ